MANRTELIPAAREELLEAFEWYLKRSDQAASNFLAEISRGAVVVARAPEIWPRFTGNTRRYPLYRYPFSLLYRYSAGVVTIVALAHHKRRPGYWRDRLEAP